MPSTQQLLRPDALRHPAGHASSYQCGIVPSSGHACKAGRVRGIIRASGGGGGGGGGGVGPPQAPPPPPPTSSTHPGLFIWCYCRWWIWQQGGRLRVSSAPPIMRQRTRMTSFHHFLPPIYSGPSSAAYILARDSRISRPRPITAPPRAKISISMHSYAHIQSLQENDILPANSYCSN